jgi:hypothetical protein
VEDFEPELLSSLELEVYESFTTELLLGPVIRPLSAFPVKSDFYCISL